MPRFFILSKEGQPVGVDSVIEWAKWFETHERRIAFDRLPTCDVSTVFLGLDHSFSLDPSAPPILWETLVIGGHLDGEQLRYSSESDALAGHRQLVDLCRRRG